MEARETQQTADRNESSAADDYRRSRWLAELLSDVVKRDEAMQRLELSLKRLGR